MKTILTFFVFLIVSLMTTTLEAQISVETNPRGVLDDGYLNAEDTMNLDIIYRFPQNGVAQPAITIRSNGGSSSIASINTGNFMAEDGQNIFTVENIGAGILRISNVEINFQEGSIYDIYASYRIASTMFDFMYSDTLTFIYDATRPTIVQARTIRDTDSRINVEIQLSESVHDTSISNHLSDFTLTHPTGYCQTGNFTDFSTEAGNITNDTTDNDQYFSLEYTFSSCDHYGTGVYTLHYNGTSIVDVGNNNLALPSEGFRLEDKIPPRILYAESFDTNEDQVVDKVEIRLTEPIKDSINGVPIDASNFLLEETFSGETIADTFDTFSTATAKIQITNTINDQYFSLDFTTPPQLNSTGVFMFMHNGNIQDIQNNVSSLTGGGRRITDGIPPGIRNALTLDTDGDGRVDKVEIELTEYIDNSKILPSEFSLTPPMEFGTTDTLSNFSTIVTKITSNTAANDQYFSLTFNPINSKGTGVDTLKYFGTSLTDAAGNILLVRDGYVPEDSAMLIIFNATTLDGDEDGNVDKVEIEASEFINDNRIQTEVSQGRFTLTPPSGYSMGAEVLSIFNTGVTEITNDAGVNDQYFSLSFNPTNVMGTGVDTLKYIGTTLLLPKTGRILTDGAPPIILRSVTLDTNRDGSVETVEIALSENINDANISPNEFSLTSPMEFGTTDVLFGFSTEVNRIVDDTDANDQYYSLTFDPVNSGGTGVDTLRYFGSSLTDAAGNILLLPDGYVLPEDSAMLTIFNSTTLDGDGDGNVDKVEIETSESIDDQTIRDEVNRNLFTLTPPMGFGTEEVLSNFSTSVTVVTNDIGDNDQYFSLTFTPAHAMGTGIDTLTYLGNTLHLPAKDRVLTDGAPPTIIQARTIRDTDSRINVEIQLSESVQDDSIMNHLSDFTLTHPTGYCETGSFTGFSTEAGNITNDTTDNDQYFSLVYTFSSCDHYGTGVYTLHYNGISITDIGKNVLVLPSEGFVLEDKISPRILYAESFDTNEDQVVDKVEIRLTEPIKDSINGVPIDASNFSLQETFSGETIADTFDTFSTATAKIQITNTINDQYFSLDFTTPPQLNSTGVFMFMHNGNIQDIQNNVSSLTGGGRRITDGIPPGIRNALTLDTDGDGRVDKVEIELSENINDTNISADSFSLTPPLEFGTTDTLSNPPPDNSPVFNTEVSVITNNTDDINDQYFSLIFTPQNSKGTGVDTLRYFGTSLTDAAGNTLLLPDGYILPKDSAFPIILNSLTLDEDGDGNVDKVEIETSEFIDDDDISNEVNRNRFKLMPPSGYSIGAEILSIFNTEVTRIAIDTAGANDQYFSLSFDPTNVMGTGVDTLIYEGTILPDTDRVLTDGAPPIILRSVTLDMDGDGRIDKVEIELSENINDTNISADSFSLTPPLEFGTTDTLSNPPPDNLPVFNTEVNRIVDDTAANDQYFSLIFTPRNSKGTGVGTLRYFGSSLTDAAGNILLLPDGYVLPEDSAMLTIFNSTTLDGDGDGNVDKVEIETSESIDDQTIRDEVNRNLFTLTPPMGLGNTDTLSGFSTEVTVVTNDIGDNDQYFSLTFTPAHAMGTGIDTLTYLGNTLHLPAKDRVLTDGAPPIILRSVTLDTNRDGSVETVEIELTEDINDTNISADSFSLTPPMGLGNTDTLSGFSTEVTVIANDTDANDQYFSLTFDPTNPRGTGICTLRYSGTLLVDDTGNALLPFVGVSEDKALPVIVDKTTDLFPGDDATDIGVIRELRMIFSEKVRWDPRDPNRSITFVENTIPPTSTIILQQNQNNSYDTLVTITIPETTTNTATDYYTVIEDGAFIDKSDNRSSVQDFTVDTAWNFRTRQGLYISSTDVNSNKDILLEFNDTVTLSTVDSSDFILRNSLDTFRITGVFHNNSQPDQVRIVINEADTASVFGDLFLSFDGVGSGGMGITKINSDAFGILEDFDSLDIDFDNDNPTLDILTFNEDTIHLTFSERVQIGTTVAVSNFTITDGKGIDYPNIVMNIIDEVVNDNKLSLKLNTSLNSLLGDLTFNYNSGILRIRDFGSNQLLNFNELLDIDTSSPTIKNIFMASGGVGIEDTLVLVFSEDVSLSSNDFTVFSLSDEKNISHIITSLIDDVSSTNDTLLLTVRDLSNVTTNLTLTYSGAIIADYGGNNLGHFTNEPILSVFKDNTPLFYCRDLLPFFLNINDTPLGIDTKDTTSVDPPEDDIEKDDFYKIEIYYKQNNVIYTRTEDTTRGVFNTGELSSTRLLDYTGGVITAGTPSRTGESWRLNLAALNSLSISNRTLIDTLLLVYIVSKDDGSAPKALASKEIYILPKRPSLTTDILGKGSLIQSSGDYELKFCDGEEVPGFVADNSSNMNDLITWFDDNGIPIATTDDTPTYLSDIFPRTINSVVNYDNRSFYNFSFSKLSVLIKDSIQGGCPSRKVNISVNPPAFYPPIFDSLINAPTYQYPNQNSLCETDISTDNDLLKLRVTPGIRNSIYDSPLIVNSFKVYDSGRMLISTQASTRNSTREEFFLFDYSASSSNGERSIDTAFHITQMSDSTEYFDGCESNPLTVNIVIHPQPDLPITEGSRGTENKTENKYVFCNVGVLESSSISIKEPDTSYQYIWYRDEGLTDILLSSNSSIGMDVLIRANVVDIDDFTTDSIYVVASSKGCDSEKQLVTIKNNPNDLGIEFADDKTGAINGTEFCLSSDSAIIKGVLEGKKVAGEFSIDDFGMVSDSNQALTYILGTTSDTLTLAEFNSEDSTLTIYFFGLHSAMQNSLSMVGGSPSVIPITFTYSDADGCPNTYTSTITIHPLPEIDFIAEAMSSDTTTIEINFTPKGEVCYDAFFDVTFSGNLIDAAGDILPINTGLKFYLNDIVDTLKTSRGIYTFSISDNVSSANISEEDTIRLEYIHPIQSNSMASDDGCMNTITKILQVNALPSIEFSFDFDSNDSTDNSFCFTKISEPDINEDIMVREATLHITATSSTISTTGDTISVPSDSSSWSLSGSSMDLTPGFKNKGNGIVDLFPKILHIEGLSNRLEGGSSSEISANFTITDKKSCESTDNTPIFIHPLPEISFGILRGTDASTIIEPSNELDNLSATICYTEESLIFRGVELAYNNITRKTDTRDAIVTNIGFTVNNQPIALQNGQFLFRMSDEYSEGGERLRYVADRHSRDTLNILFTYTHPSTECINTIKKTLYIDPLPDLINILPIQVCKGDSAIVKIEVENLRRIDSIEWSHFVMSTTSSKLIRSTKRRAGDNTIISSSYNTRAQLPRGDNPGNLIVTAEVYESKCSSDSSITIPIGEFPDPKVSWLGITKGLPTDFKLIENNFDLLNNDIDSIYYSVFEENNNRTLLIGNSIGKNSLTSSERALYSFSDTFLISGDYGINVYMRSDKGCDSMITRSFTILPHLKIGLTEYFEDFEDGEEGWLVETRGNDDPIFDNDAVSWELGLGDTTRLDGGNVVNNNDSLSHFWITGVNKPYGEGEISYLYSPSFDFTASFEKLTVSFDIYFRFESVRDGVVFQYSTDNGLDWKTLGSDETGLNWYNDNNIDSGPGNTRIGGSNVIFNADAFGWSDAFDDSKWLNANAAIPIPLEDRGSVRFRFALAAQGGSKSPNSIGFAFDNFRIFEREKTVLIEQFMSVNNEESKDNHDILDSLYKNDNAFNTIDIIWINYFIKFTNENEDLFFLRNKEDPSARASNYAINEIPKIIIAGKTRKDAHLLLVEDENIKFDKTFLNDAENELLGTSGFRIEIARFEFNEDTDTLTISASITRLPPSIMDDASELGVYFVVIEPEVILTEAMGEYEVGDTIKNVARKILPNAVGDYERGEWIEDEVRAFTAKWRVSNLSAGNDKLQVVVFIQNFDETKNIHQAKISEVITLPTIGGPTGIDNHFSDITILYPNPISDHHFVLEFSHPTLTDLLWRMYDQTGKSIKNGWIPNSVSHHQISIKDLSDGMYFIMIKNEAEQKTTIKRFLVRKEE